jgi:hypothetical protein
MLLTEETIKTPCLPLLQPVFHLLLHRRGGTTTSPPSCARTHCESPASPPAPKKARAASRLPSTLVAPTARTSSAAMAHTALVWSPEPPSLHVSLLGARPWPLLTEEEPLPVSSITCTESLFKMCRKYAFPREQGFRFYLKLAPICHCLWSSNLL